MRVKPLLLSAFLLCFMCLPALAASTSAYPGSPEPVNLPLVARRAKNPEIAFYSRITGNSDIYLSDTREFNYRSLTSRPQHEVEPAWSPDGTWIAYAIELDSPQEMPGGGPSYDIFLVHPDGSGDHKLVTAKGYHPSPDWSPDGQYLVYAAAETGYAQIYKININTLVKTRLTWDANFNAEPAWSPDGEHTAFTAIRATAQVVETDIYMVEAGGANPTRLTFTGDSTNPDWSPDSRMIVFDSFNGNDADIFIMPLAGGGAVDITNNQTADFNPAWSTDGEWIAFCGNDIYGYYLEIFKIRPDGSDRTRVTYFWGLQCDPTWSP